MKTRGYTSTIKRLVFYVSLWWSYMYGYHDEITLRMRRLRGK